MTNRCELDSIAKNVYLNKKIKENRIEKIVDDEFYKYLVEKLHGLGFDKDANVLDLGYGEGSFSKRLEKTHKKLTIIEGSKLLAEHAASCLGGNVKVKHALFEEFKLSEYFDLVYALHILEHVDDPVLVLKQMSLHMKAESLAVITVPNAQSMHRKLAVKMGIQPELDTFSKRDVLVGHKRVLNLKELNVFLEKAGLKAEHSFGYFLKVVPLSMMKDWDASLLRALTNISYDLENQFHANICVLAKKL